VLDMHQQQEDTRTIFSSYNYELNLNQILAQISKKKPLGQNLKWPNGLRHIRSYFIVKRLILIVILCVVLLTAFTYI